MQIAIKVHFILLMLSIVFIPGSIQAAPPTPEILDDLEAGFTAHLSGDHTTAIKHYTKVIRTKELRSWDRSVVYLLRGEANKDAGDLSKAIDDFSRAIKIRQQYAHAYYFRGLCYLEQGDAERAYQDVRRAISHRPDNVIYRKKIDEIRAELLRQGKEVPEN